MHSSQDIQQITFHSPQPKYKSEKKAHYQQLKKQSYLPPLPPNPTIKTLQNGSKRAEQRDLKRINKKREGQRTQKSGGRRGKKDRRRTISNTKRCNEPPVPPPVKSTRG
jgi:hypothetical protein